MPREFMKCSVCGNIFSAPEKRRVCYECKMVEDEQLSKVADAIALFNKKTIESIASFVNMTPDTVRALLKKLPNLAEDVQEAPREVCMRCKAALAQPGNEFCAMCRVELYKNLGDAADSIHNNLAKKLVEIKRAKIRTNAMGALQLQRIHLHSDHDEPPRGSKVK